MSGALTVARSLFVVIAGAVLVLFATAPHGPAISPDSAVYLSVADRLIEGRGFTQFDDRPMTRWAPLYPALVAGTARLAGSTDTQQAARRLNALCFGLVLALLAAWLVRNLTSFSIGVVTGLTLLVAPMLLQCAAFVWSEMPFLVFVLIFLRASEALILGSSRRPAWLLTLGVTAGLATVTRYAGLALVPVGLVALALAPRSDTPPARGRAFEAAGFVALAVVPLAVWIARNTALTGYPLGESLVAHASFSRSAAIYLHIVSLWLFSPSAAVVLRVAAVGTVLAALAIAMLRLGRRGVLLRSAFRAAVLPHVLYVACSTALLLIWSTVSGIEIISDRYAAPLFPSCMFVLAWTIERLVRERDRRDWALVFVLVVAGLGIAEHSVSRTTRLVRLYRGPGEWGYRTQAWEGSRTLAAMLETVPPEALVYSNAPDAIYARLHRRSRLLPVSPIGGSAARTARDVNEAHDAIVHRQGGWIVEFDSVQRSFMVPAEALAGRCRIDTVARVEDGTILRITCAAADRPR